MSFIEELEKEANTARTLNGAKTHSSSGNACLDFFAVAGGMRYRKACDAIALFDRAYIEEPDLAMKLLFYIRDIREGMGERQLFRTLIRHVALTWPESAEKNVRWISEYGRFDDLLCLLKTPAKTEVVRVIKEQLDLDLEALERRKNGEVKAHISLLAKWMPSINTSSERTRQNARILAQALGMKAGEYRKTLSALRSAICLTEKALTKKQGDRINYEAVPAGAMLKYRAAFEKQEESFSQYIKDVKAGEKQIHTEGLFPYQMVHPYFSHGLIGSLCKPKGKDVLEVLWEQQGGSVAGGNCLSVIDTSGSMYWGGGEVLPATISQSLGLYHAERCQGLFHNMMITFESRPHLVGIHGDTLEDKLRYLKTVPWGNSTNMEAVFDLILTAAVNANASPEEMPSTLFIISDMEFNECMRNSDMTVYENAREMFEAFGYLMPAVVFQNVNSWQMQVPVRAHTRGTALASGASTTSFKYKFDGNITPMGHMLRVLNSKRYAVIHA